MFNPDGALPSLTKTTAIDSLNITFESWLQNNGFIVMRSCIGVAVPYSSLPSYFLGLLLPCFLVVPFGHTCLNEQS